MFSGRTSDIARETEVDKDEMRREGILDRKNWFNNLETKADMNSCAIGIIGEIMGEERTIAYEKLFEIARTLEELKEAWNAKNPLLLTEGTEEICHPDCVINVTKAQSFLEPWYVERILREKGSKRE